MQFGTCIPKPYSFFLLKYILNKNFKGSSLNEELEITYAVK